MRTTPIEMQLSCVVNGKTWHLYGVDFETADGKFSTYVYAISEEHASHIVEELKATAKLTGRLEGWMPA